MSRRNPTGFTTFQFSEYIKNGGRVMVLTAEGAPKTHFLPIVGTPQECPMCNAGIPCRPQRMMNLARAADQLKKLWGYPPYDGSGNHCLHDSYFANVIEREHGKSLDELSRLTGVAKRSP